jgi:hypothetical protein
MVCESSLPYSQELVTGSGSKRDESWTVSIILFLFKTLQRLDSVFTFQLETYSVGHN